MSDASPGVLHQFRQLLAPFRKLWLTYAAIAAAGLAVLVLQSLFPIPGCSVGGYALPWTQCYLGASTRTPWGILTAFFVHTSFAGHYLPNMVLLFAVVFVFCVTNSVLPTSEKRLRQRAFIGLMFLSGIAGNAASVLVYGPLPSVGASGLDFAALGITLAFCLINVLPTRGRRGGLGTYYRDPLHLALALSNGLLAAGLILLSATRPSTFLSAGPGVDVVTHLVSFAFGAGTTLGWALATTYPSPAFAGGASGS